jgi:methionyl-tRNA formyltransferase
VKRARTVFFGSGAFAVPVLEAVASAPELDLVAVVSVPPRPAGRRAELTPTAVVVRAAALGVEVLLPGRLRDAAFREDLAGFGTEVGILADYGKLLPQAILDLPRRGILNLHPSLLPRHRGATPIPAAIMAGDSVTGVSMFRMDAGMDTGPLVAVERTALDPTEDAPGAEARLAAMAGGLLARSIGPYLRGELTARAQPSDGATVTRPFAREDGRLDPSRPAMELERRVRALRPWPGTYLDLPECRLAVLAAMAGAGRTTDVAGTIARDDRGLALVTADGWLRLLEVRPAGGRAMDGAAYLRGRPAVVGSRVR